MNTRYRNRQVADADLDGPKTDRPPEDIAVTAAPAQNTVSITAALLLLFAFRPPLWRQLLPSRVRVWIPLCRGGADSHPKVDCCRVDSSVARACAGAPSQRKTEIDGWLASIGSTSP